VELGREENDCIVVNPDRYPSVGLTGTAEKAIPKPRRARQDGISAENLITGSRTRKPTAKGDEYVETRKGKHRYEMSHNSTNFAYRAAFHTGLKHRLHRKNMPAEPKSWKDLQTHPYRTGHVEHSKRFVAILASRYAQLGWGSGMYRLWQLPQAQTSLYLVPSS
jgi:hypothetical protein